MPSLSGELPGRTPLLAIASPARWEGAMNPGDARRDGDSLSPPACPGSLPVISLAPPAGRPCATWSSAPEGRSPPPQHTHHASPWPDPCQGTQKQSNRQLPGARLLQWRICWRQDRPWGWPPRPRHRNPLLSPRRAARRTLWQRRRPSRPLATGAPLSSPSCLLRSCRFCAPGRAVLGSMAAGRPPLLSKSRVAQRASMVMLARFVFTLNLASHLAVGDEDAAHPPFP